MSDSPSLAQELERAREEIRDLTLELERVKEAKRLIEKPSDSEVKGKAESLPLPVGHHNVKISSVAGIGTCVCIVDWKVAVDMGVCPQFAVGMEHVLITHAHLDHLSSLPIHAQQRAFLSMSRPTYHLHPTLIPSLEAILQGYTSLDPSRMKYLLRPIEAAEGPLERGDAPEGDLKLPGGLVVKAFRTEHRVTSQGYAFFKTVATLKDEYKGLSSEEIRRKIAEGVEIKTKKEMLEVVVTGDTTMRGLQANPLCFQAQVLIMECTFIDDDATVEQARKRGHIHLDEIVENAHLFQNNQVILMHFSNRYTEEHVEKIMAKKLPASLKDRVIFATRALRL